MIVFRKATYADLDLLEHWDQQEHVIASDPNDDWNWEHELKRDPDWREQLIAEIEGRPVGFIQIIDPGLEDSQYWGDIGKGKRALDIWIGEKKDLGKGYGTEMIRLALKRCFENPEVTEVLIDPLESNKRAIRFYERIGFRFVDIRILGGDRCAVYRITREDFEI